MAVGVFPVPSSGPTPLTAMVIDLPRPESSYFGAVNAPAGTYDVKFFPASGGTPRTTVAFYDANQNTVGSAQLFDTDTSTQASMLVGRVTLTANAVGWAVQSASAGWAVATQMQSTSSIKRVYKVTTSQTIVLTGQARVFALGGGGGGGGMNFTGGNAGAGGGGSGYWQVATLSAGTYSFNVGGPGGSSTIPGIISGSGGSGGAGGESGSRGGAGGSGGGSGGTSAFDYGVGGTNGSNGEGSTQQPLGGTGGGTPLPGWIGEGGLVQSGFGAAGGFAQGGAGGSRTGDIVGASAAANTGGGGGGSSRSSGSSVNGSSGGSGVFYYYYL